MAVRHDLLGSVFDHDEDSRGPRREVCVGEKLVWTPRNTKKKAQINNKHSEKPRVISVKTGDPV